MGTNYYWHDGGNCPHCGRGNEPLHIGKSSAGWCFSLHVYPEEDIYNLEDWNKLFNQRGSYIEDEYGRTINADKMLEYITYRKWDGNKWDAGALKENHAVEGPNGLARHKIEAGHCIAHGDGTYDYLVSDFS